jgi:hypothetical protein
MKIELHIIVRTKDEAEQVLKALGDVIKKYHVASVGDLYSLIGFTSSYVDEKHGWKDLNNVEIREEKDGYFIDLPPVEEI